MIATKEVLKPQTIITIEPVLHTQESLNAWVKWINDPDVRKWMYSDLPTSTDKINEWLFNATHDERRHYFTIRADEKMIGLVSLRQDQMPSTTGEIGIVIGEKDHQSRGIGTKTIEAIDRYAKDVVGLSSVRACIKPDNEKSIRIFTGQGFVHTDDITVSGVAFKKFEKIL